MNFDTPIYVSGHAGMLGQAVLHNLKNTGYKNLIHARRAELDLTDQSAVFDFFADKRPQCQIICAANVGGIVANRDNPGDFIGANLMIQTNLLEAARRFGCRDTIFVASSCIYPRMAKQPLKEEYLLTGPLESTNEWYAVAKLAGIKMGQAYSRQFDMRVVSLLPCNLYGPGDSFHPINSHLAPALIHKLHEAKMRQAPHAVVWGTGKVRRELMHVEDMAQAIVFLMQSNHSYEILNVGASQDVPVSEVAQTIKKVVGYEGKLQFDDSYPDGTPKKLMDSSHILAMGWKPNIDLEDGIRHTYEWYLQQDSNLRTVNLDSWRT